jgi:hypothetical protein
MVSTLIKKIKLKILPKRRRIYVVLNGNFKGEWLVKVKDGTDKGVYFSLPDKYIREIPTKDFEWGILNKVLEPVDVLPEKVYNVCLAEYNHTATDVKRPNIIDRREQYSSPNALDSEQCEGDESTDQL